jgi:hypothetical protein
MLLKYGSQKDGKDRVQGLELLGKSVHIIKGF